MSLAFVVLLAACGGGEEATPTIAVTPAAGGMVVPTATADLAATEATATATEAARIYAPAAVVGVDTAVILYADAGRQSAPMSQYGAGAQFTVLEPSGDYGTYPIDRDGEEWYRLRASDGLVGWLPAGELK